MNSYGSKIVVVFAKAYKSYIMGKVSSNFKTLAGLSGSEFGALEYLYHKNATASAQELSEKILLTTSTTTYTLDKLVKRGLIQKKENQYDKRFLEVSLTKDGQKLMNKIFPQHQEYLNNINPLSDEESEQLISLLKKLGKTN